MTDNPTVEHGSANLVSNPANKTGSGERATPDPSGGAVPTELAAWGKAMNRAMTTQPESVGRMAQVVLRRLPRHLPTYLRLIETAWALKRWDEGEDWGRRLLQADPGNAQAWRALARAAEQRNKRSHAYAIWRRAFEMSPYDEEIRAGVSRTSLDDPHGLDLNVACLASLYLRGRRWEHAAGVYRALVKADPRRIDFQVCLMVALWQGSAKEDAYQLANYLAHTYPRLLPAWAALDELGDENDKALARDPIETMDPDGEYISILLGMATLRNTVVRRTTLIVSAEEARLLEVRQAEMGA
jgi:tetratricopeptide (TPR) repeat protein